jgi:hypothetical protein
LCDDQEENVSLGTLEASQQKEAFSSSSGGYEQEEEARKQGAKPVSRVVTYTKCQYAVD